MEQPPNSTTAFPSFISLEKKYGPAHKLQINLYSVNQALSLPCYIIPKPLPLSERTQFFFHFYNGLNEQLKRL